MIASESAALFPGALLSTHQPDDVGHWEEGHWKASPVLEASLATERIAAWKPLTYGCLQKALSGASHCPRLGERGLDGSLILWLCVECKAASWSASAGQSEGYHTALLHLSIHLAWILHAAFPEGMEDCSSMGGKFWSPEH